ncbi:MAG: RNAase [Deltaproteobacteria bacterium]|nr:RNAase [Deltaproteobacteria bacterium]
MHQALQRSEYMVKEHVGMFKAANNYDMLDLQSGDIVLECREPNLGLLTKFLRFTDYKRMTPFDIRLSTPEGEELMQISRGWSLFLSKVDVHMQGRRIGGFKQKLFSLGGKFDVLDHLDEPVCTLKGKWTGWDFKFIDGERELGHVNKEWAGLGKELLTSADNYRLSIGAEVGKTADLRALIIAAVMCIDMVLKE